MNKKVLIGLTAIVLANTAFAAQEKREAFWYDSNGVVIRDGNGNCLRTEFWSKNDGDCPMTSQNVYAHIPKYTITPITTTPNLVKTEKAVVKMVEGSVLFALNSHLLTQQAKEKLETLSSEIIAKQEAIKLIMVEGHTDNTGTKKYNQSLSEKRAEAVKKFLIAKGISESKIKSIGFGFEKPVVDNKTKENRTQNRRVEVKTLAN